MTLKESLIVLLLSTFTLCYGQESPKVNLLTPAIKPIVGAKTSFTCQSLSGSSPLQITWFKDGKEIFDSSEIRIRNIEDSSLLIIDSIKSSHSGNYTCKITNRFGHDSYTTELVVEGSPSWIEKPKDIKSHYGETITVNCLVSGYPKPKVQWKRLEGLTWLNIGSSGYSESKMQQLGDKLTIRNVTRSTNGRYGCSISNGLKPDLWSEFDISIEGSPSWIEKPKDLKIHARETAEIKCSIGGFPKPRVNWKKLQDSNWINLITSDTIELTREFLIIRNVSHQNKGRYGCSGSNGIEPDLWSEFELTIEGKLPKLFYLKIGAFISY